MAGFDVCGVDIEPQPHYPFQFYQDNIKDITDKQISRIARDYDAVAFSPPCKVHSILTPKRYKLNHEDLIPTARAIAKATGLPYIIENVPGAPLIDPVMVCGSALALRVRRHRFFESNMPLTGTTCRHEWQDRHQPYLVVSNGPGSERYAGVINVYGGGDGSHFENMKQLEIWRTAMGIDWMNIAELSQAIPPAYTFYLGKQMRMFMRAWRRRDIEARTMANGTRAGYARA
jgi:DNA (cytosine-5)-methyltransferase 1